MGLFERSAFGFVEDVDNEISSVLNPNMCTDVCPCFKSSAAYATYNSLSEQELNSFNRTKTTTNSADYKPLIWT